MLWEQEEDGREEGAGLRGEGRCECCRKLRGVFQVEREEEVSLAPQASLLAERQVTVCWNTGLDSGAWV